MPFPVSAIGRHNIFLVIFLKSSVFKLTTGHNLKFKIWKN